MAKHGGGRIIVLIDMDCFFCQVETKLQPKHAGKPLAVVQYNQWKLGGIIAVNYEAREHGVTRHMRAREAKEKCPELILASVPCLRGKADTSRYRAAGRDVINVIKQHCSVIERASVDEAYLDITDIVEKRVSATSVSSKSLFRELQNTFVVGYSEIGKNDEDERRKGTNTWISNIFEELEDIEAQKLAIAGVIVEALRKDIYKKTGYRCSAGIAHNKILAKLACGLHKPNRQTILPPAAVPSLYSALPVKKVRNLGGKFGDVIIESLNCNVMGDLLQYSLQFLQKRFDEKTGFWLYNIARGIDNEPVTTRLVAKSIGACKKFPGKQAIVSLDVLKHWSGELAAEVCERLEQDMEENERRATLLTICYHYYQNRKMITQSRSATLTSYKPEKMADRCVEIVTKSTQCPIAYLGICAGKFIPAKGSGNFLNFFTSNKNSENEKFSVKSGNNEENFELDISIEKSSPISFENRNDKSKDKVGTIELIKENSTHDNDLVAGLSDICAPSTSKFFNSIPFETQVSPTSSKVERLIQSLNQRNKRSVDSKSTLNASKLGETLNQEKFKGSFFINAFNSTDTRQKRRVELGRVENEEFEPNKIIDSGYDSKESDESNIQRGVSDDCDSSKEDHCSNHQNADYNEVDDCCIIAQPLNHQREEHSDSIKGNSKITEEEFYPATLHNSQNSKNETKSSIALQEIFPDLDNMDPSIISLLPPNLQEEARQYMKAKGKTGTKVADIVTKGPKTKSSKSKSKAKIEKGKKESNMLYSFLLKRSPDNGNNIPVERCSQCQQMIPISRYNEHQDFHIAENLQKELNTIEFNNEDRKRRSDSSVEENLAKRRSIAESSNSMRNSEITPFLT